MDSMQLFDISERYMELINPFSPEKIITVGSFLRLGNDSRVIDFGCGFAEPLVLWAKQFGIQGVGIDVREYACERAKARVSEAGLADRIEIVCGDGADYSFEEQSFDAATCIGASFVWGGYRQAVHAMKGAIHAKGRVAIGEPYWLRSDVPKEYAESQPCQFEYELLEIAREEGFDFEYVVRASHDDWDTYEAGNWHSLVRWIEENADHPDRQQVIDYLRKSQDDYVRYGREYMGWAVYVLTPSVRA